jgi:hypothetical protein
MLHKMIKWGALFGFSIAADTSADRAAAILDKMTTDEKLQM